VYQRVEVVRLGEVPVVHLTKLVPMEFVLPYMVVDVLEMMDPADCVNPIVEILLTTFSTFIRLKDVVVDLV
jgi:hypothetical protein